jgi:hypothetical protein
MKRVIGLIVLGIGGFAAAVGLTLGALALAGDEVGTVVQPNLAPSVSRPSTRSNSPSPDEDPASPSVEDHGGSRSDDPSRGEDHSGSGDSSGPGSGDSSGSDSSGSGSGSEDD